MSIKKLTTKEALAGLPKSRQIGQPFGPSKAFSDWLDGLPVTAAKTPGSPVNPHDPLRHGHKVRSTF